MLALHILFRNQFFLAEYNEPTAIHILRNIATEKLTDQNIVAKNLKM